MHEIYPTPQFVNYGIFLIKSSRFINAHLSSPNNTKYLLCHSSPYRNEYSLYYYSEPYRNCAKSEFLCGLNDVKVHSCCNGVVCYTKLYQNRKDRGLIYLRNPFVRKLKVLPKYGEKCYSREAKEAIGFWFDKEKNDYEVAKIS